MKVKDTMMAAVLYKPGDIRYEERPVPQIGPEDVLIRVKAAGNCGSDLQRIMVTGTWVLPCIPGHEFSGDIAKVGDNVSSLSVGQRVTATPQIPCMECDWCKSGQYNLCENYDYVGSRSDGAFAEYIKVPAKNVRIIPDSISYEAAAMIDPTCVSLHGFKRSGGVLPGETVVVMGAGPIGGLACQWGKVLGAKQVIAVDVIDEKLKTISNLGVTHTINSTREDVVQRILDLTGGKGGNLYIETAGAIETNVQALYSAAKRGRIVHIGRIYKSVTLPPEAWAQIFRKELSIIGSVNFNSSPNDDEWSIAIHYVSKGQIVAEPFITHRLPMSEVGPMFKKMYLKEIYYNKVIFFNPD